MTNPKLRMRLRFRLVQKSVTFDELVQLLVHCTKYASFRAYNKNLDSAILWVTCKKYALKNMPKMNMLVYREFYECACRALMPGCMSYTRCQWWKCARVLQWMCSRLKRNAACSNTIAGMHIICRLHASVMWTPHIIRWTIPGGAKKTSWTFAGVIQQQQFYWPIFKISSLLHSAVNLQ